MKKHALAALAPIVAMVAPASAQELSSTTRTKTFTGIFADEPLRADDYGSGTVHYSTNIDVFGGQNPWGGRLEYYYEFSAPVDIYNGYVLTEVNYDFVPDPRTNATSVGNDYYDFTGNLRFTNADRTTALFTASLPRRNSRDYGIDFEHSGQCCGTTFYTMTPRGYYDLFDNAAGVGYTITARFTAFVPEPATWAMLILGFGMIGHVMRRRQKVQVTYA